MPRKYSSPHLRLTVSEHSLDSSRVSTFPADWTRQTSEDVFEDQGDQLITAPARNPRPPGRRSKSKAGRKGFAPDDYKDKVAAETDDGPTPQRDTVDKTKKYNFTKRGTVDEAKHPLTNSMDDTMDGAKMLKTPVNNRTSDLIAELNYSKNLKMMENAELQKLKVYAEENTLSLSQENIELKKQVENLRSTIDYLDTLRDNIREARKALQERSHESAQLESRRLQLEQQNDSIRDKIEMMKDDLFILKPERKKGKTTIKHLNRFVGLLQYQDEEAQITILQKDTLIQRKTSQIEEMQSHFAESVSCVQVFQERLKDLAERIDEAKNAGKKDEDCSGADKDGDSTVTHRTRPPTLAEEIAQAEQYAAQIVKQTKKEEVASPPAPTESWFRKSIFGGLQKAAYRARVLALTVMVPLCVMASMVTACQDGPGIPCGDLLQDAASGFLKPYCTMDFTALPPF